jgi:DNA-directed RNA polymerase specialized sigma24 family protein
MATALRLYRVENRPQRAIAEQLGISVSGVEKLLQRAYRIIHARAEQIGADMPVAHRHDDGRGQRL